MLPLKGIRIIDLTNFLPGPFCSMILSDFGAEVIKVEKPPTGDPARGSFAGLFDAVNRNKKSVTINLKEDSGKSKLKNLLSQADVLLEGFRPGVMDKFGFGKNEVLEMNPRIIYCSISGYGQESPYSAYPGHDVNYLAVSGALSISGDPAGDPAPWGGVQVADLSSSMYALASIFAALRTRDLTGKGDFIDVSMCDSVLALMGPRIAEFYGRGKPGKEKFMGRGAYGAYKAKDGRYLALGCVEDRFFQQLCETIQLPELAANASYATWTGRIEHGEEINASIIPVFLKKNRDEWIELLLKADIPCSPVNLIEDLTTDPHIKVRESLSEINGCLMPSFPVKFQHTQIVSPEKAPQLGNADEEFFL